MKKGEKPVRHDGPDFSSQNDVLDKRARIKRIVTTIVVIGALVTFFIIGLISMIQQGKFSAPKKEASDEPITNLLDDTPVLSATFAVENMPADGLVGDATIENPVIDEAPTIVLVDEPKEDEDEGSKDDCHTSAGSLGWIVCPVIYDFSGTIKDRYLDWVEPALQINTLLFGSGNSSPTYSAWNVFRTIANIAFVVVFLIIIFSQLTGVGIDNYGIKKILPKLIIGAILINMSYIICQLAIDVANVVGYGVAGVFKWITANAITMPEKLKVEGVEMAPADMGLADDAAVVAGGAVVVIIGALTVNAVISQGMAIIIPVLLLVLSVFVSLFTLIAILGIRQAAAVLLVVASPLAFVCYMLPNTKKIFDKWLKAFQGLLLAFPACSALIYGGDMVGHILLSTSNGSTWIMISAAAVSVAPVFFIPKLIRSSMGAIGTMAGNLSHSLNGRMRQAGNNSRLANEMRGNHAWAQQRRINLRRAGVKKDRKTGEFVERRFGSGLYGIGPGGKERVARARSAALKDYEETAQAMRATGKGGFNNFMGQVAAIDDKANQQTVAGLEQQIKLNPNSVNIADPQTGARIMIDPADISTLQKALEAAMINGDKSMQQALVNVLSKKGEDGRKGVRTAIVNAEKEIATNPAFEEKADQFRESQKNVASHVLDNFGDTYKEDARSMYDWAERQMTGDADTTDANGNVVEGYNNAADKQQWMANNSMSNFSIQIGDIKQASLLTMDDSEVEQLKASLASADPKQKGELKEAIDKALTSEAATNAKTSRLSELKDISSMLGTSTPPGPTPPGPTPPGPTPPIPPTSNPA